MSKLKALLDRPQNNEAVEFELSLFIPELGAVPIKGKVMKADSKEWAAAKQGCARKWAEGKINADQFGIELVCAIASDMTVDGEAVDAEQLKQLLTKYPTLLEAIDKESTAGSVFTLKPQSNSPSSQSGKRGSTSPRQKAAK